MAKPETTTSSSSAAQPAQKNETPALPFEHRDAFAVYVLTPADGNHNSQVREHLRDAFDMLETPPDVLRELALDKCMPGVVVYVAHPAIVRERHPETKKFGLVRKVHVSEPIFLKDFYGLHKKNGGLDKAAFERKLQSSLVNDPKGLFFTVRAQQDGAFKIWEA
jgi:hypothetical protein